MKYRCLLIAIFLIITCSYSFPAKTLNTGVVNFYCSSDSPLGKGFTETFIEKLSSIEGINSPEREKILLELDELGIDINKPLDLSLKKQTGKAFSFDYIISGTIDRKDSKIKVKYELFDVKNGKVTAEEDFTGNPSEDELKNLFDIQSKIIISVANHLNLSLPEDSKLHVNTPANLSSFKNFCTGLELYEENRPDEAWNYFLKSIQEDSNFIEIYKYLSFTAEKLRKTEELAGIYENLLKKHPDNPLLMNYLGNIYAKKDMTKGEELYKRALQINPESGKSCENLGTIYGFNKKYKEAIEYFEKALKYSDRKASIYYKTGLCYMNLNDETGAKNYFTRAIEIEPENNDFSAGINYIYRIKLNITCYEKKIPGSITGDIYINSQPFFNIEDSKSRSSPLEKARTVAARLRYIIARGIKPADIKVETINNKIVIITSEGELIMAVTEDMSKREGSDIKKLADYYCENLKLFLAFPENFMGIKSMLSEEAPYINMGDQYYNQNKFDKAAEQYRQAININPSCATAYYNLGMISLLNRDYENSVTWFYNAIKYDCASVKAYIGLGKAYRAQGNNEEAKKAFIKARDLDPDNPEVKNLLK